MIRETEEKLSYANEVKQSLLGVSEKTLTEHGAVSEETVKEMVKGAISKLNTDYAIATSGIAGPGGGTAEKPVGTVWIAIGNSHKIFTKKELYPIFLVDMGSLFPSYLLKSPSFDGKMMEIFLS